uniref:RNA-dependent RNA polymerase n=1 Tax=Grapevine-associated botourmia-like virus 7 TaxID=2814351 RepID=A0A8F5MKJ2_9VIRU|nr:MAG: RNA-dependent RNA polymerase [Grapevine-associated botourmia-like virus 7]
MSNSTLVQRDYKSCRKAGCPASRSLRKALKDALIIVCMEFKIHGDSQPLEVADDCSSLRITWEGMWGDLLSQKKNLRTKKRLSAALKSTRRLFDRECVPCDEEVKENEKNAWQAHMASGPVTRPSKWAQDPLAILALHIRELLSGWRRSESEGEDIYCPDQQGCFEVKQGKGGTLACSESEESTDYSLLRLGVAKTKGKARVVTMQPARVKRILSPVHNALYNHLSSYGWLVRGDFTKEDAETVIADRRPGELFTSGDYSSATNELHQDAVKTVVAEICNSEAVSPDEKRVLWRSFQRLRVSTCHGITEVRRGSMMGNLCSFPILCLINKACYDIVCDIMHGPFSHRKGRFNGDDCLFNSSEEFYQLWTEVTSTFGLVVNHEKTGRSARFLELNSNTYDANAHRFVAKPVLSFLLREKDSKECLITQTLEGLSSFGNSVREYAVHVLMRREISLREINIQTLPQKWLGSAIKRAWFRNTLCRGPVPIRRRGVERCIPMVVDRPLRSRFYPIFDRWCEDLRAEYIARWKGQKVRPLSETLVKTNIRDWIDLKSVCTMPYFRLKFGPRRWRFVWPRDILNFLKNQGVFERLTLSDEECESLWVDDHRCLKVEYTHTWSLVPRQYPQPPELDFRIQYPLGYS